MPDGESDRLFVDALENAAALYEDYLKTARLTDLSSLACNWWAAEDAPIWDGRELLDFQLTAGSE
jgi:hypothetical protein